MNGKNLPLNWMSSLKQLRRTGLPFFLFISQLCQNLTIDIKMTIDPNDANHIRYCDNFLYFYSADNFPN
uniref:Uncharacterized protein n=1 Tax=Onchocerca volvulus TaxID=6282 RepID=A0A8R1XTU3_ONCVO